MIFVQVNIKLFKKMALSYLWVHPGMAKVLKINNNYAISLQYFKKVVSDEVDFLHADKHQNILQVDTTFFVVFMYLARSV